ncbi:MAG TPA: helix-turn-helix domain-containing protein [bacterium]|nr:helix-turn-helix domain-containing protein [bacterium]HQL64145.1 helix-turn-helix domain-containing protein [bacterium]
MSVSNPDLTLLKQREASKIIGVSPRTMELWRRRGTGPRFAQLTRRSIRYDPADLRDWLESSKRNPTVEE